MQASVRAIHIATVLKLINENRPLDAATAPLALKKAIKDAANLHDTESRRVHRNFVWALDYRGRGAQNRAANDLIDPAAPNFRAQVQANLSAFDAQFVIAAMDKAVPAVATTPKQTTPTVIVPVTPTAAPTPTATAIWLNEQISKNLIDRLANTVKARYPIEDIEDVRGEVHLRIAHWAAKGSFDDHIAEGHPPTVSRMAAWVGNRVKSTLGRRGQDALWRQMRGSRTESEYRREEVHPDSVRPDQVYTVGIDTVDDEGTVQRVIIDPKSLDTSDDDAPDEMAVRDALRLIIRASRPNAFQRYIRVLESMVADASRGDIAAQDGCTTSRAGKLTARVREDLRVAAWSTVSDARKILRYIVEEPYITHSEILEDLRMCPEDVDRAMRLLTDPEIQYVSEAAGQSYAATDFGLEAATAPAQGGVVGRLMI